MSPKALYGIDNDGGEPEYGDFDDDEYSQPKNKRPKWQTPNDPLEVKMLTCVNRKYYQKKSEVSDCRMIVKAVVSLETGVVSKYPTEWVEHCIDYFYKLKKKGVRPNLDNLIKYINNDEKKVAWINAWTYRNKKKVYDQRPKEPFKEKTDFKKLRGK